MLHPSISPLHQSGIGNSSVCMYLMPVYTTLITSMSQVILWFQNKEQQRYRCWFDPHVHRGDLGVFHEVSLSKAAFAQDLLRDELVALEREFQQKSHRLPINMSTTPVMKYLEVISILYIIIMYTYIHVSDSVYSEQYNHENLKVLALSLWYFSSMAPVKGEWPRPLSLSISSVCC